jgi:hypothetical protein
MFAARLDWAAAQHYRRALRLEAGRAKLRL